MRDRTGRCSICIRKTAMNCGNCAKNGGSCAFDYVNLGAALSSAAVAAQQDFVDNRIMFTIGKAWMDMEGDDIELGFNCRFLIDSVKVAEGENLYIKFKNPNQAITIEAVEESDDFTYCYVIVPVRMDYSGN